MSQIIVREVPNIKRKGVLGVCNFQNNTYHHLVNGELILISSNFLMNVNKAYLEEVHKNPLWEGESLEMFREEYPEYFL